MRWKISRKRVGETKRELEDTVLQAHIESIHEDSIGERLANQRARLHLALEAQYAVQVFGLETKMN